MAPLILMMSLLSDRVGHGLAFVLGVEALGPHFAAARFSKDHQFHVQDLPVSIYPDHVRHGFVLADGILDQGIAVNLLAGLADVDFEKFFRKFPADPFFDLILLLWRQIE